MNLTKNVNLTEIHTLTFRIYFSSNISFGGKRSKCVMLAGVHDGSSLCHFLRFGDYPSQGRFVRFFIIYISVCDGKNFILHSNYKQNKLRILSRLSLVKSNQINYPLLP